MNMHNDEHYELLEERLAEEARRMLDDSSGAPLTGLRAELMRRRQRRVLFRAVSAATAIVIVAVLVASSKRQPAADADRAPIVFGNLQDSDAAGSGDSLSHNGVGPELSTSDFESGPPAYLAIAILIPGEDDRGEPKFLPGWYVPEQVEVLGASDLSPAERSAVSRLLGLEPEMIDDETI
jgi:hypothetical protein